MKNKHKFRDSFYTIAMYTRYWAWQKSETELWVFFTNMLILQNRHMIYRVLLMDIIILLNTRFGRSRTKRKGSKFLREVDFMKLFPILLFAIILCYCELCRAQTYSPSKSDSYLQFHTVRYQFNEARISATSKDEDKFLAGKLIDDPVNQSFNHLKF